MSGIRTPSNACPCIACPQSVETLLALADATGRHALPLFLALLTALRLLVRAAWAGHAQVLTRAHAGGTRPALLLLYALAGLQVRKIVAEPQRRRPEISLYKGAVEGFLVIQRQHNTRSLPAYPFENSGDPRQAAAGTLGVLAAAAN